MPPQLAQQVLNKVLQQISIVEVEPVGYSITAALVESSRCASAYVTKGRIFARRDHEAKISLNTVVTSAKWAKVNLPETAETQEGSVS